ncbi:MAG: phosphoribosyltransferase family protein [bacterium]|nr:phosphoribosyltransferase family protein [bacterium]
MWHNLLDLLFPRRCLGCGQSGTLVCARCLERLPPAPPLPLVTNIIACFDYEAPLVKKLIWQLKYQGLTSLAEELSYPLHQRLLEEIADLKAYTGDQKIIVVPVPLSAKRRRERGYNQAALLARALARRDEANLEYRPELLLKIKHTPPQVALKNRAARLRNLRGAFAVSELAALRGRAVIIIDDVTTTGATLAEALKTLKQNGAEYSLGAALAHGE